MHRPSQALLLALALVGCAQPSAPGPGALIVDPDRVDLSVDGPFDDPRSADVVIANIGESPLQLVDFELRGNHGGDVLLVPPADDKLLPGAVATINLSAAAIDFAADSPYFEELTLFVSGEPYDGGDATFAEGVVAVGEFARCDADVDGYVSEACGSDDCDDSNDAIRPSADEMCDGIDNNCDGQIDEPGAVDASSFWPDTDGDTFGDPTAEFHACSAPPGFADNALDCDDENAKVSPVGIEVCNSVDDDCNGTIDDKAVDALEWHADVDGDQHGSTLEPAFACTQPPGYLASKDDCDDKSALVYPGAPEICDGLDDNCNGVVDEDAIDAKTSYADTDGDGHGRLRGTWIACTAPSGYVPVGDDCDDTNPAIHPGAPELCNGIDDDCNSLIDDGAPATTYFRDSDGDTFGDNAQTTASCSPVPGYATVGNDCNDADKSIFPGAIEVCDGKDQNCDGLIDNNATDAKTWFADTDSDTYGDKNATQKACVQPTGYLVDNTDCDDKQASVHPSATEVCNGKDDNCNGLVDEGATDTKTFYLDDDGDGHGLAGKTVQACTVPPGFAAVGDDCDDTAPAIHPGAPEICNGKDDDCNGLIDDGSPTGKYFRDADGDTYGDKTNSAPSCSPVPGYVTDATDCNDASAAIHPGATEICDGIDQNCDGLIDNNASDAKTWFADADGDTYGTPNTTVLACAQPPGTTADKTDCDDTRANVHPGAPEICDGLDDNCDGKIDNGATGGTTWYRDNDRDGYGGTVTSVACVAPPGYIATGGDCNDKAASIHPGATETCNGQDDNCEGTRDEGNVCPCPVFSTPNAAYMVCNTSQNALRALGSCQAVGYTITTIDDAQEDAFIDASVTSVDPNGSYWIGLTDFFQEGNFVWFANGATPQYTDWEVGSPNDPSGNEDCVVIDPQHHWVDVRCTDNNYFVCEHD